MDRKKIVYLYKGHWTELSCTQRKRNTKHGQKLQPMKEEHKT